MTKINNLLTVVNFSIQYDGERTEIPLSIENTMWANTVIASGGCRKAYKSTCSWAKKAVFKLRMIENM